MGTFSFHESRSQLQLRPIALAEPEEGEQEPHQLVQGGAQPGAHQAQADGVAPVSYTHLTTPFTNSRVAPVMLLLMTSRIWSSVTSASP